MGTTAEKINYAINATNDIAEKIVELGGNITPQTPLGNFANELETIYNNLPKTTAEGTSLSITDARAGKMVIQPKGNTSQNSYTGKNLANITNIPDRTSDNIKIIIENDTITIKDNTNTVGYSNTYTKLSELCPNLQVGDKVYLFFNTTSSLAGKNTIYLSGYNNGWGVNESRTITQEMIDSNIVFYGGYEETAVISNFMITKENDNTYEPYTNGPAPNPSYPQIIKNVREDNNVVIRGKNLASNNFDDYIAFGSGYYGLPLNLEKNKAYTLSATRIGEIKTNYYNYAIVKDGNDYSSFVDLADIVNYSSGDAKSECTFGINDTWVNPKLVCYLGFSNVQKVFDDLFSNFNIQFEESSQATTYEPYITPIEKPLNLKSKNLYDFNFNDTVLNNVTISKNNGKIVLNGTANASGVVVIDTSTLFNEQLKGQTCSYSIRINKENKYRCWIGYIKSDNTVTNVLNNNINTAARNSDYTLNNFVFPSVAYKNRLVVGVIDGEVYDNFEISVQIELNISVTSYEPYYDYTLSKIGDYQDIIFKNEPNNENYDNTLIENAWYKKAYIGKVVFDGSEDEQWIKDGNQDNSTDYFYIRDTGITSDNINTVFCDKFVKGNMATQGFWATLVFCITINKTYTGIVSEDDKNMRIQKFKTWLSNNNTILYYQLATPTYTQITETPLINQLESLNRTIIPNETIVIETESDEENAQLVVNAKALKGE